MILTEYVPDYILRNYLRIGQTATILVGSAIRVHTIGKTNADIVTLSSDLQVVVTNFLPGHTDVYADSMGKRKVHNTQVVWKSDDTYYSTDINNVKEIRDAA